MSGISTIPPGIKRLFAKMINDDNVAALINTVSTDFDHTEEKVRSWLIEYLSALHILQVTNNSVTDHVSADALTQTEEENIIETNHGRTDVATQTQGDDTVHHDPDAVIVSKTTETVVAYNVPEEAVGNHMHENDVVHHAPEKVVVSHADKGKDIAPVKPTDIEASTSSTSMYSAEEVDDHCIPSSDNTALNCIPQSTTFASMAAKAPSTPMEKPHYRRAWGSRSSSSSGSCIQADNFRSSVQDFQKYLNEYPYTILNMHYDREEIKLFTLSSFENPPPEKRGFWLDDIFVDISCMYGAYNQLQHWSMHEKHTNVVKLTKSGILNNKELFAPLFGWSIEKMHNVKKNEPLELTNYEKARLTHVFGFMAKTFPDAPLFSKAE